jgi:hypothetical protein
MVNFLVFCYDVARFVILTLYLGLAGNADAVSFFFPLYSYITAIALFPIMSFFLWVNTKKNAPFAYLYTAGKTINAIAVIQALVLNINTLLPVMQFWNRTSWIVNSVFPVMILVDVLTIIILLRSAKNVQIENDKCDNSSSPS